MDSQTFKYADFLHMKLQILECIRKNTYEQSLAWDTRDYALIQKLLKARQGYIDSLEKAISQFNSHTAIDINEEVELTIKSLLQEIIDLEVENTKKAECQKEEYASSIRHINLSKNAFFNGYLKKMPQRNGYFIDKKLDDRYMNKVMRQNKSIYPASVIKKAYK